ncbi:MAG: polysaccharide biosynthesis protein [Ferruginibacter sp.]
MKSIVNVINGIAYNERALNWVKLITITGSAQLVVQFIGLISGIAVIRLLPTHEYGLYTLANTMLGTMIILADGGISYGVMAQGGKVWQDKVKLGVVLATGMQLRKLFAVVSLIIAVPCLLYLLRHHNASWMMSLLVVISLVPAFFTSLSGTLLQIPPQLNQDIGPLQKNSVISNLLRLVLTFITLFAFPWAFVAVLAAGLSQLWANIKLKKIASGYADWLQVPDPKIKKEILSFVVRILPGSIYYCISGQITIWLISIFGNTSAVAEIGALGRLAMTLSIFSTILSTLVLPRFARLSDNKKNIFKKFAQIQFALWTLGGLIIGLAYLFPNQILWVLGKEYGNLKTELVLTITGSCLGLIAGSSFALATSRGWAINPLISIPLTIAAIALGIMLMDISTLIGILKFNLFVYFVEIMMYYVYCAIKISNLKPAGIDDADNRNSSN